MNLANIGGERVQLQVAHIKLSHSRAFLVRAYPLQTHEMLFDAWHAFRVFGGVPGEGIYDNMKTAVDRVGKGKQRDINARFKAWPAIMSLSLSSTGGWLGKRPGRERARRPQPHVAGHAGLCRSGRAEPVA